MKKKTSIYPGAQLAEFGNGRTKRSVLSSSAHNDVVRVCNALLKTRITRGDVDKFLISDHNLVLQLSDPGTSAPVGTEESPYLHPFKIYQTASWLTFKVHTGLIITTGDPIAATDLETNIVISTGYESVWFYLDITTTTASVETFAGSPPTWACDKVPIGWVDTLTGAGSSVAYIYQFIHDNIFVPTI